MLSIGLLRGRGDDALRLDCVKSHGRLRAHYEAQGFVHRGGVPVGGARGSARTTARSPGAAATSRPLPGDARRGEVSQ
ncbi:hypothetical protein XF35_08075 [Streptomyces platensis subsp. clarensis]|nr:hypothetical protein [Streptomyces platensis subsp. clarensis]